MATSRELHTRRMVGAIYNGGGQYPYTGPWVPWLAFVSLTGSRQVLSSGCVLPSERRSPVWGWTPTIQRDGREERSGDHLRNRVPVAFGLGGKIPTRLCRQATSPHHNPPE